MSDPFEGMKPAPVKNMKKLVKKRDTFCQVVRDIFEHPGSNEDIKYKSRLVLWDAKQIVKKLTKYKRKFGGSAKVGHVRTHTPVPLEEMENDSKLTLHSILQHIYRSSDNDEIKLKCRKAMSMATSMYNKLEEYRLKDEG